jgi:hypothetical protein
LIRGPLALCTLQSPTPLILGFLLKAGARLNEGGPVRLDSLMAPASIRFFSLCLLILLAVAMAACSDDDNDGGSGGGSGSGGADSQFCADLDRLRESLRDLGGLTASSSGEEAGEAGDDVLDALNDVRESASDEAEAEIDNLEHAWNELRQTVEEIDEETSISAIVNQLRERVTAVLNAAEDVYRQFECP